MNSHIGKGLSIQHNTRLLKTSNKTTVRQSMLPGGGIDSYNPKAAEIPLSCPSIAISIHSGSADSDSTGFYDDSSDADFDNND